MKLRRTIEIESAGDYRVGDVISFTLKDGEPVEALAVKQEQDGMVFVFVDCLRKEYSMNSTDIDNGGYDESDLRKTLNSEIVDRFPDEIREKMVAFENGDFLRLPTERELTGDNSVGASEKEAVDIWEPMKDHRNRIAYRGDKDFPREWYWVENKAEDFFDRFVICGQRGLWHGIASDLLGARPVFKLK